MGFYSSITLICMCHACHYNPFLTRVPLFSRRILTDYGTKASSSDSDARIDSFAGFEGHPLRKDFPLTVSDPVSK